MAYLMARKAATSVRKFMKDYADERLYSPGAPELHVFVFMPTNDPEDGGLFPRWALYCEKTPLEVEHTVIYTLENYLEDRNTLTAPEHDRWIQMLVVEAMQKIQK